MKTIPIYFDPRCCPSLEQSSPSARKPVHAVESFRSRFGDLAEVRPVHPTPLEVIETVHSPRYVKTIASGDAFNGFGTRSLDVARSLPWTVGALETAARGVLRDGGVACAPVSGFHHASYDQAEGFCTFNGLVVVPDHLRRCGPIRTAAILDLDYHYGNGTQDLLRREGRQAWCQHFTSGCGWTSPELAERFLDDLLPRWLIDIARPEVFPDLFIYQAGADAHVDDPLGGWMTSQQLRRRDHLVFNFVQRLRIPTVWCLAGGYQTPLRRVLDIHDETFAQAVNVFIDEE